MKNHASLILNPSTRHTLRGAGLRIVLDPRQIVVDEPGAGDPAVIHASYRCEEDYVHNVSATWPCFRNEGEIEGFRLNQRQADWLATVAPAVEAWFHAAWALAKAQGGAK